MAGGDGNARGETLRVGSNVAVLGWLAQWPVNWGLTAEFNIAFL
jgi:hypothetical protein